MSQGRLTFLYSHLFKQLRATEVKAVRVATCRCSYLPAAQTMRISTDSTKLESSAFAKRHGKAVQPQELKIPQDQKSKEEKGAIALVIGGDSQSSNAKPETTGHQSSSSKPTGDSEEVSQPPKSPPEGSNDGGEDGNQEQVSAEDGEGGEGKTKNKGKFSDGPMKSVLQTGESEEAKKGAKKKPALVPPPYIHQFDTYMITKKLEEGTFTEQQSIQIMKAMRMLISINLNKAKDVLVSKSDVENETYLFRAACSELSTEVKNNRKAADEHQRQQRTMLQHEMDILTQSLNQELATLEDTVKNMFNERKMAVKDEENETQGAIQQLHLRISSKLNSDAKSDIEGVRWVIMRMAAGGIGFVALLALIMFNYVSTKKKERKEEAKKKKIDEEERKRQVEKGKIEHSDGPAVIEILAAS
ncbi:hypothetical protein MKZ38_008459 [Zalerion maritima]|uniref:MOZ protein represents a chromatin-associated acetyltransferase n=1 Tax=Zalerion maritima TaxID=339359 RepID=A0AAD5RUY7_9PEZI|nr:hypothetical protein MKZ38_008459 [Zalerion maritima]